MIAYRFQLYDAKRNRHLDDMLAEASFVWNRCLAVQRRYYALFGKYASCNSMKKHFAKRYAMRSLHSQTVQEVIERLDRAYARFFKRTAKRPPKFKRKTEFSSFVFKQGGYRMEGNAFHINKNGKTFRFHKSRDIEGNVKTVTVKRTPSGRYFLVVVTDAVAKTYGKSHDGASVGLDFGLKTYLTASDGTAYACPEYLKRNLSALRKASRRLSRCERGSNHRKAKRLALARLHRRVCDMRSDFQWKLSHELCRRYDVVCVEDLGMEGMRRRWGRKVSDLAHSSFLERLDHVAAKYGVKVVRVDRWYASTRLCHDCGYKNDGLSLSDRTWTCPRCGAVHDRDLNAARNIHRRGISDLGSGSKTGPAPAGGDRAITQESR